MSNENEPNENENETADTIHNVGKVQVADHVRLMAENQQTLNMTRADDRRSRELHARVEEAEAKEKHPELADAQPPPAEEDMKINIDSPVTTETHHHYPPEPTQPAAAPVKVDPETVTPVVATMGTLGKAVLTAALLGSGAGLGAGIPWLAGAFAKPAPPAYEDTDTQYELHIGPPPAVAPDTPAG